MNTIKRIKEYIDYKGISNKKFEESVGFSNGAFASQLKNNRTIGVDKLENILSIYNDLNPRWLLTGNGDMLISTKMTKESVSRKLKHASTPLAEIEKIGVDQYVENEIEEGRLYLQNDISLLERFIKTNNVKNITDSFSAIQGDVSIIDTFLSHYDLQSWMLDSLKAYRNKEIDYESLKKEFKEKLDKESELYKLIEPYKEMISELYAIVSDFNNKHDRLYCIND